MSKNLSNDDHVLRFIKRSFTRIKEETQTTSAQGKAFLRRENEPAISVVWVEYFKSEHFSGSLYQAACSLQKLFTIKPTSLFAIGNVGEIKQFSKKRFGIDLRITNHPTQNNKSHSRIYVPKLHDLYFDELVEEPIFSYRTMDEIESEYRRQMAE